MVWKTPLVHLSNDRGHDPPVVGCNMQRPVNPKLTEDRSEVTCGQCKKTFLFRFRTWNPGPGGAVP